MASKDVCTVRKSLLNKTSIELVVELVQICSKFCKNDPKFERMTNKNPQVSPGVPMIFSNNFYKKNISQPAFHDIDNFSLSCLLG